MYIKTRDKMGDAANQEQENPPKKLKKSLLQPGGWGCSEIHLATNKTCHFLSKDGEVEGNSENVTESDVYFF